MLKKIKKNIRKNLTAIILLIVTFTYFYLNESINTFIAGYLVCYWVKRIEMNWILSDR